MIGILVTVDQSFIKIKEYGLEVGIFTRELDMFARIGDFDALAKSQYLNLLIKMLPEEVHQVAGLMLPQAAVKLRHIVLFRFLRLAHHL